MRQRRTQRRGVTAAKAFAKAHHLNMTVFDAAGNAQTQFNQIQTAISSGKYNAFSVLPVDPNLVCNLLSKNAPKANIVVAVHTEAICGRFGNVGGDSAWTPGTLDFVSDFQDASLMKLWLTDTAKAFPGKQTIGVISGDSTDAESLNLNSALAGFSGSHPNDTFLPVQYGEYTATTAYSETQSILAANPGVTLIMSTYSGMTTAIVQAIAAAGKSATVKVVDYGGDSTITPLIKSGAVGLSFGAVPKTGTNTSLAALVAAFAGKKPVRQVELKIPEVTPATWRSTRLSTKSL